MLYRPSSGLCVQKAALLDLELSPDAVQTEASVEPGLVPRLRIGAILTFDSDTWERLESSRDGIHRFTIALSAEAARKIRARTVCVILSAATFYGGGGFYLGYIKSKSRATTLESRLNIAEVTRADQTFLDSLVGTHWTGGVNYVAVHVTEAKSRTLLRDLLESGLNRRIIERLSTFINPGTYADARSLEQSAVELALKVFGLRDTDGARSITLTGDSSAATRVRLIEDAVIEHDARWIPGLELVESHMTGKAVFEKNGEILEVYTANKRDLERLFGVDLIYYNVPRRSIVMVQYKMMEPQYLEDDDDDDDYDDDYDITNDWLYRPDSQLDEEIARMDLFAAKQGDTPYRLNSGPFYMKFVKRHARADRPGFIISLDHFKALRAAPDALGPKGGIRISYARLEGHYLQNQTFIDLVRSGYIGSTGQITPAFKELIDETLRSGRALVAAIHSNERREKTTPESLFFE